VIADVAGKGVPAALLMAFLRASLRAATHIGYAPHISMAKVNYLLWNRSSAISLLRLLRFARRYKRTLFMRMRTQPAAVDG